MKKIIFTLLIAILAIPCFAGTKMVTGSVSELIGAKVMPVSINWNDAIYGKAGTLEDFLSTSQRNSDWEKASLEYFLTKMNASIVEYGVRVSDDQNAADAKYKMEIVVNSISKGGDIKGEIVVSPIGSSEPVAIIAFSSDDADSNDKIAFRDQFKSIGSSLGKLFVKEFKAAEKANKKK